MQRSKDSLSTNGAGTTGHPYAKKKKIETKILHPPRN